MPRAIPVGEPVTAGVPDPQHAGFAGEFIAPHNPYPGAVPVPGHLDVGSKSNPARAPSATTCQVCGRTVKTAFALKGHMKSHAPKRAQQRRKKQARKERRGNGNTK